MAQLNKIRAAVFAVDGVEESELTEPVKALCDAGVQVEVISLKPGKIQAFKHHDKTFKINVDRTLNEAAPDDYQVLLLPGGALNADAARIEPRVREFVRSFELAGKPMAVICHAPWLLVSAGLVKGRTLTGYKTIEDDIRNAGGNWVDREVVVDGNWVTSRKPSDLPAFIREMLKAISDYQSRGRLEKAA
ncbi:MAG: protease [Nitrospirae bacterium GWC2_57_9]|nr:MAG: protease [Nitrospirae bacterium GWC2_57_9]